MGADVKYKIGGTGLATGCQVTRKKMLLTEKGPKPVTLFITVRQLADLSPETTFKAADNIPAEPIAPRKSRWKVQEWAISLIPGVYRTLI